MELMKEKKSGFQDDLALMLIGGMPSLLQIYLKSGMNLPALDRDEA